MNTQKQELIQYLLATGKNKSWDELAEMFGLKTGEVARHAWRDYRKQMEIKDEFIYPPYPPSSPNMNGDLSTLSGVLIKEDFVTFQEDMATKTAELSYNGKEVITLEQLMEKGKIDTHKWQVEKYYHTEAGGKTTMRVAFKPVRVETSPTEFVTFLKTYQPQCSEIMRPSTAHSTHTCLVFPKQDAHFNKLDIYGDNNIKDRFDQIMERSDKILRQATSVNQLDKIIYIVGSDEMNSEWTGLTTKGTPQQNILSYHEAFAEVCNHEISMLTLLLSYAKEVLVVYVGGNHDEYVSWHIAAWLKAYFRNTPELTIDLTTDYTKYIKYSNTAICLNHGDAQKPERLAQNFPIEFKEHWSSCDHYYIFTGDKHHEISRSIGGIKFYQVPALSRASSRWDLKNGFTSAKAEMTAFLIEEGHGLTNVYKEILN